MQKVSMAGRIPYHGDCVLRGRHCWFWLYLLLTAYEDQSCQRCAAHRCEGPSISASQSQTTRPLSFSLDPRCARATLLSAGDEGMATHTSATEPTGNCRGGKAVPRGTCRCLNRWHVTVSSTQHAARSSMCSKRARMQRAALLPRMGNALTWGTRLLLRSQS